MLRAEAVIDTDAIRDNVALLKRRRRRTCWRLWKADGLRPRTRAVGSRCACRGATWLGTATIDEALDLRAHGLTGPTLAWLWTPGEVDTVSRAVAAASISRSAACGSSRSSRGWRASSVSLPGFT